MSLAKKIQDRGFDSDSDDENDDKHMPQTSVGQKVLAGFLQIGVFVKLNGRDISARKGTYCLGLSSCMIVVIITAVMLTTMSNLPVLFLRLAEIDVGERDLELSPGGEASDAMSLNYSIVLGSGALNDGGDYSYHTPRIIFTADATQLEVHKLSECQARALAPPSMAAPSSFDYLWSDNATGFTSAACTAKRGCVDQHCTALSGRSAQLVLYDAAREDRMRLGRNFAPAKPGKGEVIISGDLASSMKVAIGDVVLVHLDLSRQLLQAYINAKLDDWFLPPYTTWGKVIVPMRVSGIADQPGGKFADAQTSYMLADYDTALQHFADYLNPAIAPLQREWFGASDPRDMATQVIFNFPPARRRFMYTHADAQDVLADATSFASPIIAALGFNQLDIYMGIVNYIRANRFFSLFMGLILSLIIFGLGFLCIVLIHALLSVGVQTRTFELGVMRMVGMTKPQLTGYVITGAALFAIPAWIIGLILSQLIFLLIRESLTSTLGVDIPFWLSADAIGYATLAGLAIPLISVIAPVFDVLSMDLPTALDTSRSHTKMVIIDINRPGMHINWTLILFGAGLVVFGFLIHYLFPRALVNFDLTLLFYIFFGILLGMLFGLVLLTINFEQLIEKAILYGFFFWESSTVFLLIKKNLVAHRLRNRKTTLMFTMSLGFIIFLSVTFTILIVSIEYAAARRIGGALRVSTASKKISFAQMSAFDAKLLELRDVDGIDVSWTWTTSQLNLQNNVSNATFATIGRFKTSSVALVGVAPNFWEVASKQFLIVERKRPSPYRLAESLYTFTGSASAVLSTVTYNLMGLQSVNDAYVISIRVRRGAGEESWRRLGVTQAVLDSSPVLQYSKFNDARQPAAAVSVPALLMRSDNVIQSFREVFFAFVVINVGRAQAKTVSSAIETTGLEAGIQPTIDNFADVQEGLQLATQIISYFFAFAQIMASIICYFTLTSSVSTNIYEQTKEIGLLRCIGLRKGPCWRVYVWEAFIIVFAASLMGVIVGSLLGYTIVLQRALFTQLPLPFVFPWLQLGVTLGVSVFFAFVSSFGPIRVLLASGSITSIMRRTV
jgi:ABC-type antimicrobial peptide transport system permease subunit